MRFHVLKWLPGSWTSLGQNEMLGVRWAGMSGRETTAPQTVSVFGLDGEAGLMVYR